MITGNSKYTGSELLVSRTTNFGRTGLLYVSNLLLAEGDPLGYRQWGRYNGAGRQIKYPLTFSRAFTFVTSGGYSIIVPAITGQESDILSGVPYFARITDGNSMQADTGSTCQIYWVAIGA